MQRVLSKDLWIEVRKQARASNSRKAAIAYVTRDLVGFRKGDTLVVDASTLAIKNGETDAPLLQKLHKRGVQLYDCTDLHAKILLLDDVAIIGSGNMSSNSERWMVEAALISDHGSVVAGVASLIEQLVKQSSPLRTLSKDDVAHYQKIVVALAETIRLMKEIDEVIEAHGGWPSAFQAARSADTEGARLVEQA